MKEQQLSFDITGFEEDWQKEWVGMPDFIQEDLEPVHSIEVCFKSYFEKNYKYVEKRIIKVNFENYEDIKKFGETLGISGLNIDINYLEYDIKKFKEKIDSTITELTPSIWFPKIESFNAIDYRWHSEINYTPKYPVYIISKGRWESRLTAKALEEINIDYKIVIEPQEFEQYASVINKEKILILPFSNLGQGSIPARNWVWEHSLSIGAKKHWILDDNIDGFGRLHNNKKIKFKTNIFFKIIEDFVSRYENVKIAGCEYDYFLPRKSKVNPYRINTRIYSNILIDNSLNHRWRGKYNEDTDLSIRALKDGWCTVLFHTIFAYKTPTLLMKGGNTDTIYNSGDLRKEFAESLAQQHPDIVKVVWRYDRWHHEVNYDVFKKNKLIRKNNLDIPKEINNYGLFLKNLNEAI